MNRLFHICFAAALSIFSARESFSQSELYLVYGPRGSLTFTSERPKEGTAYRTLSKKSPYYSRGGYKFFSFKEPKMIKSSYDNLISEAAREIKIEPAFVKAVIHAESAFDPEARSPKGAMGLMQLMPQTARRFGVSDPYHPLDNVRGGTTYLRFLLDRYDGDVKLALAAYNAGEGAVDKFGTIPPYRETQDYVRRVISYWKLYRCEGTSEGVCG